MFSKQGELPTVTNTRWWQLKYFLFSPWKLGKMNPVWRAYFSNGVVQPPSRLVKGPYKPICKDCFLLLFNYCTNTTNRIRLFTILLQLLKRTVVDRLVDLRLHPPHGLRPHPHVPAPHRSGWVGVAPESVLGNDGSMFFINKCMVKYTCPMDSKNGFWYPLSNLCDKQCLKVIQN